MIGLQTRESLHFRLARYYLEKLRAAEAGYQRGHEHLEYALAQFDADWLQIKKWRDWAAERVDMGGEIAALCKDFPQAGVGLLTVRQRPHERLEWIEAGLGVARQSQDTQSEMILLYLQGRALSVIRSLAAAQEASGTGLTLAQKLDNPLYMSRFLVTLGNIYYYQDEYELSETSCQQALTIGTAIDATQEIGQALNGLGNIALSRSDDARAFDYYSRYLAIAERNGQPHSIGLALRNLSLVTIYMGEDALATEYAERCVALSRASGDQSQLGPVYAHLGDLAWARGDMALAGKYYQESLNVARLLNRPSDETNTLSQMGDLLCRTGDFSGAIATLEQALVIATRIGERWYSMMVLAHMSEVYRRTGDISASLEKLRDGLEIVNTVHSSGIRAFYLLKAALLWAQQESMEQAAIWIGVLQANEKELIRHHDSDRADLDNRLKEMLGPDEYARLTAHGKSLNLDLTIQQLLRHLTDRPALHTAFNEPIQAD